MRARKRLFSKFIVAALTLLGSAAVVAGPIWASAPVAGPSSLSKAQVAEGYGRLPLFFTENQGQTDPQVKFYTRGPGHAIFFTSEGMVLSLSRASDDARRGGKKKGKGKDDQAVVQLRPQGIRSGVEILATDPLPGKVNYYVGNDPGKWRTEVPTYKSVLYREAYPGIDLKFYGVGQQVEYDLIIKPGADPRQVKFLYQGIKALQVTREGDLTVTLPGGGKLVQKKPVIYQEIDGRQVSREGKFRVLPGTGKRGYGFDLASYDARYPLIIDPVTLVYSTYLGGSIWESANAIAVDSSGSAYVAGTTQSGDFPVVTPVPPNPNIFGTNTTGGFGTGAFENAFVTKFNPAGNALEYSTYLGGTVDDLALGVAVDAAGNAYVTGETSSPDFPTTLGAFQRVIDAQVFSNAFVTKLKFDGTMVYSTYLGGTTVASFAWPAGIAVDAAFNAYVAGTTDARDFPTTPGALRRNNPHATDTVFITKLDSAGANQAYSTYLGGTVSDTAWGIALDAAGNAYVTGQTSSDDFPSLDLLSTAASKAFVAKLNSTGAALEYSVLLGGLVGPVDPLVDPLPPPGNSAATGGIAVNQTTGEAYVAGNTNCTDFPTSLGAFQTTLKGANNAFVTKFNSTGTRVYSTYLGGNYIDIAWFIAVDSAGQAHVTGETQSSDFPLRGPYKNTLTGFPNAFVTRLNSDGSALVYSTYLGGTAQDYGFGIALDSLRGAYVAGFSTSSFYTFTVSGITTKPLAGATYTDGTPTTYTVVSTILTGTAPPFSGTVTVSGAISPTPAAGSLTKTSGTGDASVAYSAWAAPAGFAFVTKLRWPVITPVYELLLLDTP